MFQIFIPLWLTLSPFPFEIKSGFVLEPFVGASTLDRVDSTSLNLGLRLSWIFSDVRDRCFTLEAQGSYQLIPSTEPNYPNSRLLPEGAFVFYEFFNPWAFRVAIGGGMERREREPTARGAADNSVQWSPLAMYRGGIGFYAAKEMGVWLDVNQRQIFRNRIDANGDETMARSAPLEFTLSSQWIF